MVISASPSLPSSFSFLFLSIPRSHPDAFSFSLSLRFSFLPCPSNTQDPFLQSPSFPLCSLISLRALLSLRFILHLARSLDEAYGISPIPSFAVPRSFPSTPRLAASPFFLSFSLSSFLSLSFLFFSVRLFAHLYLCPSFLF